jgi:hypothetical protein
MMKWIAAASMLLGLPGPEDEYEALLAEQAAKVKKRDEDTRDAHKALDEGDYDRAVALAKGARRLDDELKDLRAKARVLLRGVISEHVSKLDHDEFEVREAASAKLRALGPAAVPGLVKIRATQTSPETRYRIDELLKGISVDPSGRVRQWAREATASSQYTASGWSAAQVIGPPDTLVAGDAQTAWAAKDADGGTEWLHVKFPLAVKISKVRVHETFTPGGVVAVDVVAPDGTRRRVWEGADPSGLAPVWFEVDLQGAVGREVVITLDTKKRPGWEEIDAVELVGELLDE